MIDGIVQVSQTPYGEVFDFSIPGKNISHFYLHDKDGKWYELSRSVLQSYSIILKDTEKFPVQFTRETGDIASLEAGEDIRTRVIDLIKGVPFGDDLQFHFDHIHRDNGTELTHRTLQEIGFSSVDE